MTHDPIRILRMGDLRKVIGLGSTAIYQRLDPESKYFDPTFPKPVPLGGTKSVRAVGWIESEVQTWLREQIRLRDAKR